MIYVQCNYGETIPSIIESASALYGGLMSDFDINDVVWITYEDLDSITKETVKENLFLGSVEFMTKVFSIMGYKETPRVSVNSNRESVRMKLSEAVELSKNKLIFVKPHQIKLFTGFVIHDDMDRKSIEIFDPETEVLVYDAIMNLVAEYRCYIRGNEIVGIKDYAGDSYRYHFNIDYISDIVKENYLSNKFPSCYTIDIGVTANNENFVVEYNDMWAIGNYGLPDYEYYKLLRRRYYEIVRESKWIN